MDFKLDDIRPLTTKVSQNSKYVKINDEKLKDFSKLLLSQTEHWLRKSPFGILDLTYDELVNLIFIYQACGFCYWGDPKWTIKTIDNENLDGSFAFVYILVRLAKKGMFKNLESLEKIDFQSFQKIMQGNVEIPLLRERYLHLKEIVQFSIENFNGNFANLANSVKTDNEFFELIKNLKCFKDYRTWNGENIPFFKRAQLLISEVAEVMRIKNKIPYKTENLVGCADYKLPQILREFGVLEYNNELSEIVDNKTPIKENNPMEIEIRANTLVVIDKLKDFLPSLCPMVINDAIWLTSQTRKCEKPYHLTLTTSY